MPFGGDAPSALTVMWILTALTSVFVSLRIYTRLCVVHAYGIDDHVYNFAFFLLLCYVIMITISGRYGFGQTMTAIHDPEDAVHAILFEAIGQTFAVVGMAVAKWSLGLFLLRLVTRAWHKAVIWTSMCVLMAASISVCFVFWLQCTPPAYLWDRRIKYGVCLVDSTPVSMLLCILCVLVDFFFALFPWMFIWGLQMNKREKMVIMSSLSLGVIAGACGIKRTMEVPELSSPDYLKATVGLIVWSAAEISVTMICIGIPICRPLYKSFLERLVSSVSGSFGNRANGIGGDGVTGQSQNAHHGRHHKLFALSTIGGSPLKASRYNQVNSVLDLESGEVTSLHSDQAKPESQTGSRAFAVSAGRRQSDEDSQEHILGQHEMKRDGPDEHGRERGHERDQGIHVTDEYKVTSSTRRHK